MIPLGILFSFISLGILVWVIFSATKVSFKKMLQARSASIEEMVNQSRRALSEAKEYFEVFKIKLAGVDKERDALLTQMKKDLVKIRERMVVDANDLSEKIIVTAKRT